MEHARCVCVDLNAWETGGPLGSRSARATQGEKKWSVFKKTLIETATASVKVGCLCVSFLDKFHS